MIKRIETVRYVDSKGGEHMLFESALNAELVGSVSDEPWFEQLAMRVGKYSSREGSYVLLDILIDNKERLLELLELANMEHPDDDKEGQ